MSSAGAQAAALPWGTTEDAPRAGAAAAVEPDLPSQLGLGLGSRIEVLWLVHTEEEGAQEEATLAKWWGAVLEAQAGGETDGEGRQVYRLRYDPDADSGFEESETRHVTFLCDHSLYDLQEGESELLHWRREGEAWEPPAAAEGEEEEEEEKSAEGGVCSLQQIVEQIHEGERLRGSTVEEDTAEALSELPKAQQMHIASGFRDFADRVGAALAKLTEQHGADYVVTEADMRAATAAAMQAAMRGGL